MGSPVRAGRLPNLVVATLLALLPAAGTYAQGSEVMSVRTGITAERTRIVFDMSQDTPYRYFRLSDPPRVVVDLEGAALDPALLPMQGAESPVRGLTRETRSDGVSRIVIDLREGPYDVRSFALGPNSAAGRGHRIVVDIFAEPMTGQGAVASAPTSPRPTAASTSTPAPDPTPTPSPTAGRDAQPAATDAAAPAAAMSKTPAAGENAVADVSPATAPVPTAAPAAAERRSAAASEAAPRRPESTAQTTVDFSGTWEHEWAWATEPSASQKFESFLHPRWDVSFANGVDVTAILRLRFDATGDLGPADRRPPTYSDITAPWYNSAEAELSLRELFVDFTWAGAEWRLGKQQVVWGQADGLKVLDVVNPQSFREFILDDFDNSRIPLWTANVSVPLGDTTNLQLLWIPDTTYHELAEPGTPFAFSSPRLIPELPIMAVGEPDKPDDPFRDSDAGLALTGFVGGWDFSINYLYRYLDIPVLAVRPTAAQGLRLEPEYRRSHLLGGSFSNVFDDVTVRGEVAYNSDSYPAAGTLANAAIVETPELSAVLGVDWMLGMDTLLSMQWFASYLTDYVREIGRDETEQTLTLLYQQDFGNATWRFRGIGIHSLNDRDSQWQLRLSYWYSSALELWIGGDLFTGTRRGVFGQFDDNDRALVGFRYGF